MKAQIKILHSSEERTTKNGKKYKKILALITLGGVEFVREFYLYL